MSVALNQKRIFLSIWQRLQPINRRTPEQLKTLLSDKRFGGRDRRLYRELVFTALRLNRALHQVDEDALVGLVAQKCAHSRDTVGFREAFGETSTSPIPSPANLLPEWISLNAAMGNIGDSVQSLLTRAPVWIRVHHTNLDAVARSLTEANLEFSRHPVLANAWRLPPESSVVQTTAYQKGWIEVQDIGSQILLQTQDFPPGQHWLDACAGAGGKTLQLADLLGPKAQIDAHDIRRTALNELKIRAQRAHLSQIQTPDTLAPKYDGVLVDAPCSGSGTWRRSPHLISCTEWPDIESAAQKQLEILTQYSQHVRSDGMLIYATCSLCRKENHDVAQAFLSQNENSFENLPPVRDFNGLRDNLGLTITPDLHDGDGFYVACFRRKK